MLSDGAVIFDVKEEGERERCCALSFAADRPRFVVYAPFFVVLFAFLSFCSLTGDVEMPSSRRPH